MSRYLTRDRLALLAAFAAPPAFAAILVPFRASFPDTDAAPAMLLVIGVAVTEIAVWGRRQHVAASRRAGYLDGYTSAARAVATGSSASVLMGQVTSQLTQLLSLRSCSFQYGVAGIGRPGRLLAVALADQVGAALATSHPVGP